MADRKADRKRKGKAVSSSSQVIPRFKTLYHEAHFNSKLSARRILPEIILQADENVFNPIRFQIHQRKRSFEAINTRMDRMDDQLSFLCYSNQMANEQMLSPYQNTARQFKEMKMQGFPVTMANLAIHRQREEELNQERMRYNQILQKVTAQQAREANKGKT
ncbi:hypothetical protein PIB30_104780 [Stylosanthes scabra]|uniref:Uncharacterized protein n=1 Tax=Stylosanthes scabra TaxID=79078 RepID=A0ABU6XXZ2_9FABA|nr:hypothetical protein [Stylosanthes scabra]